MKFKESLNEGSGSTKAKGVTIGDKFIPRDNNKTKQIYTIKDIYTVINSKGKIVNYQFWATHDFMGQEILSEHPASSVIRGKV